MIAFLAGPVTIVIYRHGRFTAADAAGTAAILALYMIGVPFISALRNVAAVFYAHKDARSPMVASFVSVGINLVFNVSLMGVLGTLAFPLSAIDRARWPMWPSFMPGCRERSERSIRSRSCVTRAC